LISQLQSLNTEDPESDTRWFRNLVFDNYGHMGIDVNMVALLVIAGLVFLALRPRPEMVVQISQMNAHPLRGAVPKSFVRECNQIVQMDQIEQGRIFFHRKGSRYSLKFSSEIPPESHQKFRNAWTTIASI